MGSHSTTIARPASRAGRRGRVRPRHCRSAAVSARLACMTDSWQAVHDAYPIIGSWCAQQLRHHPAGTTGRRPDARLLRGCARGGPVRTTTRPEPSAGPQGFAGFVCSIVNGRDRLVHSTAEAMTMIALGLELEPGDSNPAPWKTSIRATSTHGSTGRRVASRSTSCPWLPPPRSFWPTSGWRSAPARASPP